MTSAPQMISIPEAARRLGKSPQSVRRLIARRKLTSLQIPGTHPRVSLSELTALVNANTRPAA